MSNPTAFIFLFVEMVHLAVVPAWRWHRTTDMLSIHGFAQWPGSPPDQLHGCSFAPGGFVLTHGGGRPTVVAGQSCDGCCPDPSDVCKTAPKQGCRQTEAG